MNIDTVIETVRAWMDDRDGTVPSEPPLEALREMLRLTAEAESAKQ